MDRLPKPILLIASCILLCCGHHAPETAPAGVRSQVYAQNGCLYEPSGNELALYGVNLQPCLSWEYNSRLRSRGVSLSDLHEVIDGNIEELSRMKVNMIRCHLTPADFTDDAGNLVQTPYLDALDYMVAKAGQNGMYVTLAFLNHMGNWYVDNSYMRSVSREDWIHLERVRECSKRYVRQLLKRVNPYTETTYATEKSIAYWELINEPSMYSYNQICSSDRSEAYKEFKAWADAEGKTADESSYKDFRAGLVMQYIDSFCTLISECGSQHPVVWSHNWHRYRNGNEDIFAGALSSKADAVACCNYPGQDYVPQDYWNKPVDLSDRNFTEWFNTYFDRPDGYGWMTETAYDKKAKVVYEFETFFNQSTYLYPAQAQYFRALGIQAASMWTYCMKEYAQYHAGSHFLSLTCTPGKTVGFIIAQHIFKTTPRGTAYDRNISEQFMSNYVISASNDLAIWSDEERFYHTADVSGFCPVKVSPKVKEIIGIGNSPLVSYSGTGIYFINVTEEGLEISLMPDHKWIREPWDSSTSGQPVSSLDSDKVNTLDIRLYGWEEDSYTIWYKINGQKIRKSQVSSLSGLQLRPGDYLVTRNK